MSENVLKLSDIQESNDNDTDNKVADYSINKKYIGIWEQPRALDVLLDVVGSEEYIYKLTSTNYKKKLVWEEISSKIEARGISLGDNPCKVAYQKWLNLKKTFLTILNKKGGKTPAWFGKLNDIFERSEGKLLGNTNFQGEEEQEEDKEPALKKMKQEFLPTEEEDGQVQIQLDSGQFVIEEVGQVTYGDVIAIMQQLESERREREEAREKREKERFDKLAELLKQQNNLTEKLITILSKPSTEIETAQNSNVLPIDSAVRIITTDEM